MEQGGCGCMLDMLFLQVDGLVPEKVHMASKVAGVCNEFPIYKPRIYLWRLLFILP